MIKLKNIILETDMYKYPKTLHLPTSPGINNDDKVLKDLSHFEGMNIIATIKMDGENTTMYNNNFHARSIDGRNHPSRNYVKGMWASIKNDIPENWRICGENLYAKHSIEYDDLPSYFMVFSIWDEKNNCLSWKDTGTFCEMIGFSIVPTFYEGIFDLNKVQHIFDEKYKGKHEGYVIRNKESFSFNDFSKNIAKWVRKGHIQTDSHWATQQIIKNRLKND